MKGSLKIVVFICALFLSSCKTEESGVKYEKNVAWRYSNAEIDDSSESYKDVLDTMDKAEYYFQKAEYGKAKKLFIKVYKSKKALWKEKAFACARIAKIFDMDEKTDEAKKWFEKGMKIEKERGTFVVKNVGLFLEKHRYYRDAYKLYSAVLKRKNLSDAEFRYFKQRKEAMRVLVQFNM